VTGFATTAAAGEAELADPEPEAEWDEDEEPHPETINARAPSPTEPIRIRFPSLPLNMTGFLNIRRSHYRWTFRTVKTPGVSKLRAIARGAEGRGA
jgi:hypothetical protein